MEIQDLRRKNLRDYLQVDCENNAAELARRIKRSPSQVNDLLAGRKSFGEKFARIIEPLIGKSPGWLDAEHSTEDDSAFLARLISLQKEYRALDNGTKAEIDAYLRAYPELQHLLEGSKPQRN